MELRVCGVEGIEKEDENCERGMGAANCVGSRFSVPIPCHSSVLFFSPSALQTRRSMRSEPGDGRHGAWEGSVTGIKRKVCWGGEGKNGKMWEL